MRQTDLFRITVDGMTVRATIPDCITVSEEFRALNEAQRESISQRISLANDLLGKMFEWLRQEIRNPYDTWIFLDNLELDSWSIISIGTTEQKELSAWLIHSSWTFDHSQDDLIGNVAEEARRALDSKQPAIESTTEEIANWVQCTAEGLSCQLQAFVSSTNYKQGIASLVIIDSLISQIHTVATKMRTNPNLKRPRT